MINENDANGDLNQYRRPRYAVGDRVCVVAPGPFQNWRGVVWAVKAVQTSAGAVRTYFYHLDMENRAQHFWPEESLAPVDAADDEPEGKATMTDEEAEAIAARADIPALLRERAALLEIARVVANGDCLAYEDETRKPTAYCTLGSNCTVQDIPDGVEYQHAADCIVTKARAWLAGVDQSK